MNDMSAVIVPKSDQINADDLLAGPKTITITSVTIRPGTDQPISVFFDGDNGKPYKPCKSMARVMVHMWGDDSKNYTGHSMTLYCDPKVTWGGMAIGGIRISHMSHIDKTTVMALTATKGSRKPFTVHPLVATAEPKKQSISDWLTAVGNDLAAVRTAEEVEAIVVRDKVQKALASLTNGALQMLTEHISKARERTNPAPADLDATNIASMVARVAEATSLAAVTRMKARTNAGWKAEYDLLSSAGQAQVDAAIEAREAELRAAS